MMMMMIIIIIIFLNFPFFVLGLLIRQGTTTGRRCIRAPFAIKIPIMIAIIVIMIRIIIII